jgi:trehalose 6-phosphate phosphatase
MPQPLTSAEPIVSLLALRPSGVFLDIDGTISRIAPTPQEAYVSDGARVALAGLQHRVDRLTFISGRSPESAAQLVGVFGDRVAYVGNHGLSLLIDGRTISPPEAEPYAERVSRLVEELATLAEFPGIGFEPRGPLLTIHYRRVADAEVARDLILRRVRESETARGMELSEGRRIVELRPPLEVTKGKAIEELASEWKLASILMMGDDVTDISAFDALRNLREYGDIRTLSIAVLSSEADPAVADAADYTVEGVSSVESLLAELSGQGA